MRSRKLADGVGAPKGRFQGDGYNDRQIHRVLNRRPNCSQPDYNPNSVTFLPYVGTLFNRISRVLTRHNVKSVGLPCKTMSCFLRYVKDNLRLRTPVYTESPVSAARSTLGRQAVPWTRG
jgi:hypothetical protein